MSVTCSREYAFVGVAVHAWNASVYVCVYMCARTSMRAGVYRRIRMHEQIQAIEQLTHYPREKPYLVVEAQTDGSKVVGATIILAIFALGYLRHADLDRDGLLVVCPHVFHGEARHCQR